MKENPKLPSTFTQRNPWEKKSNAIWPVTTFNLKRNIARFYFPSRLSKDEMNRLMPLLTKVHLNVLGNEQAQFFAAEELSALDKTFLFEHFLCEESFQNAGNGQGVVVASEGHFLALFNIHDHMSLQWVDCCDAWEDTWGQLAKLEKAIGSELPYAFSTKFGYLTSQLQDCGTGLTVSAYLHVPALNHTGQLPPLLHNLEEVRAKSMEGPTEHLVGDFIVLKNAYTLGVSEEGILRAVHLAATKLVGFERAARTKILKENDVVVKDLISRAYGLLIHSYQLSTRETLGALSMIKLGIDLGWVVGMTDQEVNAIFLQVRRGHLLLHPDLSIESPLTNPNESPPDELQIVHRQRAAFVHKRFKEVQLKEALL